LENFRDLGIRESRDPGIAIPNHETKRRLLEEIFTSSNRDSIPGFNPGIPGLAFFNPEIPGLEKKSGIAIPRVVVYDKGRVPERAVH